MWLYFYNEFLPCALKVCEWNRLRLFSKFVRDWVKWQYEEWKLFVLCCWVLGQLRYGVTQFYSLFFTNSVFAIFLKHFKNWIAQWKMSWKTFLDSKRHPSIHNVHFGNFLQGLKSEGELNFGKFGKKLKDSGNQLVCYV